MHGRRPLPYRCGIRGETVLPAGPLSYRDLNTIVPFGNRLVVVDLTGEQVRQALEVSAAALSPEVSGVASGGFLQVSGLAFVIDAGATPYTVTYGEDGVPQVLHRGDRVGNVSVTSGSTTTPLDDGRIYRVVMNEFVAGGGDGYPIVTAGTNVTGLGVYDIDPVAEYLRRNSPATPAAGGRIAVVNAT